ncbi:MAG: SEC-C metal-binding domain-containing protein [Parasphingorhabdus sp.]
MASGNPGAVQPALQGSYEKIKLGLKYFEKNQKGHVPCFCKSGKRYRDCHRPHIITLQTRIIGDPKALLLREVDRLGDEVNEYTL